ncbi:hypothetical protein A2242_03005 [Candidatus Falkowbacteria bacterium RIFOXYA2_FULL_47_9]|uniref:Cell division protein FtsL n=2 Tax=Candidatus Falkowiibacteriota TaxID=1752728 RepID=A0A1F5SJW0_9BACT|nr:MAG: hypothetical protein A2242_03005 [Candidatus Falkowbacteria bacterium RIFOXYA2_FULL_47_9]
MDKEEQQAKDSAYALNQADPNDEEPQAETALRRPARISFRLPFKINAATAGVFLFISAAVAACAYLMLSNHLITQGFALNSAKERLTELTKQNQELELAVMQGESYDQVSGHIAALGMVAAGDVEYLEVKSSGVAMR